MWATYFANSVLVSLAYYVVLSGFQHNIKNNNNITVKHFCLVTKNNMFMATAKKYI